MCNKDAFLIHSIFRFGLSSIRWTVLFTIIFSLVFSQQLSAEEILVKGRPLSYWLEMIQHKMKGKQVRAARSLSEAPVELHKKIIPQLIPLLKSKRRNNRSWVAMVLGNYGPPSKAAMPMLLEMLKGTEYERNRTNAAIAIGQILVDAKPSAEVTQVAMTLSKKLNEEYDTYADVRREAAKAIGMIGPAAKAVSPRLLQGLKDFKKNSYPHDLVRGWSAWACGRIGPGAKEHIDLLISMLHNEKGANKYQVVEAIGRIGAIHENVVPNILDAMEKYLGSSIKGPAWHTFYEKSLIALQGFGAEKSAVVIDFVVLMAKGGTKKHGPLTTIQMLKFIKMQGSKAKKALPYIKKLTKLRSYRIPGTREKAPQEVVDAIKKQAKELKGLLK